MALFKTKLKDKENQTEEGVALEKKEGTKKKESIGVQWEEPINGFRRLGYLRQDKSLGESEFYPWKPQVLAFGDVFIVRS